MAATPLFSLIVPTRQRPNQLERLLESLAATAANPAAIEVVLVVDADDPGSIHFRFESLPLNHVIVPPGLSMGSLNRAGYEASRGKYLMLLNDDVVARTKGWDRRILAVFKRFTDGIVLVHPNDTVFKDLLCTFPVLSRTFCELAGGICPGEYQRYRIDDHIEDIFNLLGELGEPRIVYLPDVVFEHHNFLVNGSGVRQYFSEPETLARDAVRFESLLEGRKELALKLKARLSPGATAAQQENWRRRLSLVKDSFALRVAGRHRVETGWRYRLAEGYRSVVGPLGRARACLRQKGMRGIFQAVWRRIA
jgi:glycosyltransferase involved in cell wall biosynthesis